MRIFYVCSWGGSGSTMLAKYLSNFGRCYHIHSKNPPLKLTYPGDKEFGCGEIYKEWFTNSEVSDEDLKNSTVIFIYRNPVDCILSRFIVENNHETPNIKHLTNIQAPDKNISLKSVVENQKDLYDIDIFFNNYTEKINKNYDIFCVKYEDFFSNISMFNNFFSLPDKKELYPIEKVTKRKYQHVGELSNIYKNLIFKMKNMSFIEKK